MRQLADGAEDEARARLDDVRRLLDEPEPAAEDDVQWVELDVVDLYRVWAATYDEASRPVRAIEQPVVWSLLEEAPPGRALDAACGTGRHARRLAELGHDVVGIDLSPEMVERARALVPSARFESGELAMLTLEDESVSLTVCGLALDHLPDLVPPMRELARVTTRGGRIVVSDVHPVVTSAAWRTSTSPTGRGASTRNSRHLHSDYMAAFAEAGLSVQRCLEPRYDRDSLALKRTAMRLIPEATQAAYLGLPGVVVWDVVRP
jgi:ubiquinone/menaquinone biosynthesis C-methylase UbiE